MNIAANPDFQKLLKSLPEQPGVYQYYDSNHTLIYVGKAKNLKRRVNSYFNKEQEGKVRALVQHIASLEYIVVNTEVDALLLENNLIKLHKPRYNILLKDDKTYPWLCISQEDFPRIFQTRQYVNDGSLYFGPYPSVRVLRNLLDLIFDLYPIRNCRHRLTAQTIRQKKVDCCLQYHIKRCAAPCQGLQTKEDYQKNIQKIIDLVKGHFKPLFQDLKTQMTEAAENLDFKKAQLLKEKIELLQNYQSKSLVVNDHLSDIDVFSTLEKEDCIYINYMKIVEGHIHCVHTMEVKRKLNEEPKDMLASAIPYFRERFQSDSKEIVIPYAIDFALPLIKYIVPKSGDKKKLLELSQKNILYHLIEKNKRLDLVDPERHSKRLLNALQKDLFLKNLPSHIECFDNSNMQGDYAVAAMTVSRQGKLSKKDYRHFNIRTVVGANDYASMEEIITRRYQRLLREEQPLPQLIIVDGGKGQLSSAYSALKRLHIQDKIDLIGIAERLEEIYKVGDPHPLLIDKKSETLRHIQLLRDEAHRFGITHYRKKHIKGVVKTELSQIQGIGEKTAQTLLQQFKSVRKIKETSQETLAAVIGNSKARIVFEYFHSQNHQ